jgi:hypothetical protein
MLELRHWHRQWSSTIAELDVPKNLAITRLSMLRELGGYAVVDSE